MEKVNQFEKSLGTKFYDLSTYGGIYGNPILDFSEDPIDTFIPDDIIYGSKATEPWYPKEVKSEKSPIVNNLLYSTPADKLTGENYLNAIFGNEGGKLNQQTTLKGPQGQRATATGTYQITEGTRKGIYNKHFKSKMTYSEFDRSYRSNPNFEKEVALALTNDNIKGSKTAAEALGKWYSPLHASTGKWNVIPSPEYGNRLTVGQYVNNIGKRLKFKEGGKVSAKQMLLVKCYKDGGKVKSFKDQLQESNLPIIENTATPIVLPPTLLYDKTRIVNGKSPGISKSKLDKVNSNFKVKNEIEKNQELEDYKLAKTFHENNPLKKKKPVTAMPPTTREMLYGAGAGIDEFYKIPKIGILNDFVNPLHVASSGIIAPWAKAPLQAQQSDSYLPYAMAGVSTALSVPVIKGSKTILKPSVDMGKNVANKLEPIKDAKNLREIIGYYSQGIPFEKTLPRLNKENVKQARIIQNIGRSRDEGKAVVDQWKLAIDSDLNDELFKHVFGKTKTEAKEMIANGFGEKVKKPKIDLTRPSNSPSIESVRDAIDLRRNVLGADIANNSTHEEVINELLNNPSILEADAQIRNMRMMNPEIRLTEEELRTINELPAPPQEIIFPEITPLSEEQLSNLRRGDILILGQNRNNPSLKYELKKGVIENFPNLYSSIPYYKGPVKENLSSLFLRGEGSLKNVNSKVDLVKTNEGIKSGDVITGSLNTSHSSYLPQIKQIFKYKDGKPQFLGYKPMNSLGYLSNVDISNKTIANYLNAEIDELIKRKVLPKNIQRPYLKEDHILLPHYGIKKFKQGGQVPSAKQQLLSKILNHE
jgi:hypothetical protein